MGTAWMAIKDGINHGIIFRKDLKKYCTAKKWNINPKTFNANILRNIRKSGELADVIFEKNHRKMEVLLLRKEELWGRLRGIHQKVQDAKNVALLSLQKRETSTTSQYYVSMECTRSQPIEGVRARLLMIDPQQSEILYDYDSVWTHGEHETKLFRGFPQRLLILETIPSPVILGGENERVQFSLSTRGKEERFKLDKHYMLIVEVYGEGCYAVEGFFLFHATSMDVQIFKLVGVRSANYEIVFSAKYDIISE